MLGWCWPIDWLPDVVSSFCSFDWLGFGSGPTHDPSQPLTTIKMMKPMHPMVNSCLKSTFRLIYTVLGIRSDKDWWGDEVFFHGFFHVFPMFFKQCKMMTVQHPHKYFWVHPSVQKGSEDGCAQHIVPFFCALRWYEKGTCHRLAKMMFRPANVKHTCCSICFRNSGLFKGFGWAEKITPTSRESCAIRTILRIDLGEKAPIVGRPLWPLRHRPKSCLSHP